MREQFLAIFWAQLRITRNHFPRTSFGTLLSASVTGIWYMLFILFAVLLARALQAAPLIQLPLLLSVGLLAVFAYMLVVPLATISAGWSLQLDKLQAFPISNDTLFLIEVLLRLTSSPEMVILLMGGLIGLELRRDIFPLAPLAIFLFLSFSLFIQLAVRDFLLHSLAKSRYRELFAVLFVSFALVPQLLANKRILLIVKPYMLALANGRLTPWHATAGISIGAFPLEGIAGILGWNAIAWLLARGQFMKSLRREDSFRQPGLFGKEVSRRLDVIGYLTRSMPDPFGCLVEKEFRSLLRMPRFRVLFGMACVFSIIVFMPIAMQVGQTSFLGQNALPITSMYGMLLLSDVLLLNIFGFDRGATQLFFVTPASLSGIVRAKNLVAVVFVGLQSLLVPLFLFVVRVKFSWFSLGAGCFSAAVETLFLLSAGNLLSVYIPRPIDPRTSFRQQSGAKPQLWLLGCTLGMFLLVSAAYFARWATDRDWVLLAVLSLEIAVGLIVYRISLESTIEHALSSSEAIVTALSRNASPVST